jgi:Ca-activated chloride channel homolog
MNRVLRIFFASTCFLFALAAGLAYPLWHSQPSWFNLQSWQNPAWLLALPIGAFALAWHFWIRESRVPRLQLPTLAPLARIAPTLRSRLSFVPESLRAAVLTLAVFALARPINVRQSESGDDRGIDIIVVLDLSGSMRAIMEASPPTSRITKPKPSRDREPSRPTRLDVAKEVILDFVERRKSDRIGVVVFGKSAYILSPPTLDKSVLANLVSKMDLSLIDGDGTAIGDAVGTAAARLRRSNARSKVIILLTDGDSNAGTYSPEYATHLAKSQGVQVHTVQIGNGDEAEVQTGTDLFGQPRYARARFPINPRLLRKIAEDTGGGAYVATDKTGLEESMQSVLDHLEKSRFSAASRSTEELFPSFLLPAALLLALEVLMRVLVLRRFP